MLSELYEAAPMDEETAEALTRTKALYDAGVLTEEEYSSKKNELLRGHPRQHPGNNQATTQATTHIAQAFDPSLEAPA
mgnify:CR=1 FL=1